MANTKIQSEQIEDDIALGGNPTTTTQSAGNNTTRVATTAFVTTAVANLVDSAPSALDTLNELAAAMGDDASFSTTITNSIATKLPLAGGTMTGNIAHASDFTIDAGGDITFDAGGGDFVFADDGTTIGAIVNSSTNFVIKSAVSNSDLLLQGNDGGSIITALTLDMSEAGAAHFNTQVGIGSAPVTGYGHLQVRNGFGYINEDGSNTKQMYLRTNYDTGNPAIQVATAHDLLFATSNTTRMTIDSGGNVGIGVTPSTLLSSSYKALQIGLGASIAAHTAAGNAMKIGSNMVYEGTAPNYYDKYLTSATAAKYELDVHGHKWYYAASGTAGDAISWSEVMRLDSSGNVLLGTNTTSAGNEGVVYFKGDSLRVTRDGNEPLVLDRLTNQGKVIELRQAGTTRGLVGTVANDLFICTADSGHNGLRLHADGILPTDNAGDIVDGDADLGISTHRFKDLYLSGGVFLGGTGSANKLDDYEEGTLTFGNIAGHTNVTGTPTQEYALYTKVGNLIHIQARFSVNPTSTGKTAIHMTTPFAMHSGSNVGLLGLVTAYATATNNAAGYILDYTGGNDSQIYIETNVNDTAATGFTVQLTYRTS